MISLDKCEKGQGMCAYSKTKKNIFNKIIHVQKLWKKHMRTPVVLSVFFTSNLGLFIPTFWRRHLRWRQWMRVILVVFRPQGSRMGCLHGPQEIFSMGEAQKMGYLCAHNAWPFIDHPFFFSGQDLFPFIQKPLIHPKNGYTIKGWSGLKLQWQPVYGICRAPPSLQCYESLIDLRSFILFLGCWKWKMWTKLPNSFVPPVGYLPYPVVL